MTTDEIKTRIAAVEKKIDEATCWGAYVSELSSELRELKRQLLFAGGVT